jgi:hypothetical protein
MLESPAYRAMKDALDVNADYIEEILLQSLQAEFRAHRPFIWRLLAAAERKEHRPRVLQVALDHDRNAMSSSEQTEFDRFLQGTRTWDAGVN